MPQTLEPKCSLWISFCHSLWWRWHLLDWKYTAFVKGTGSWTEWGHEEERGRALVLWHKEPGSELLGCDMPRAVTWEPLTFSSWGFFLLFIAWADKPSWILWYYPGSLHVANKCGTVLSQNRIENKQIFRNLVWEYCSFVYESVFKSEIWSNLCMFSFAWENDLQQQASVFWISHCL